MMIGDDDDACDDTMMLTKGGDKNNVTFYLNDFTKQLI